MCPIITYPYEVGDKIKIIDGGSGSQGCNGCEGIVTSKINQHGLLPSDPGFNVELSKLKDGIKNEEFGLNIGRIWKVNLEGEYELISKNQEFNKDLLEQPIYEEVTVKIKKDKKEELMAFVKTLQ